MKAVAFTGAGGNEVVEVVERPDPVVGPDDPLVAVTVAGMNPADLEQREGRYPAPRGVVADVPGLEVAGSVLAVGERVTSWRPGNRVFGLVGGGGLASRVVVHERCVTRVPERLDPGQAAAVPEAFITAHDALRQCRLRPGETVLVHGATGAVGSAAVGIACVSGARVIAPIGNTRAGDERRASATMYAVIDGLSFGGVVFGMAATATKPPATAAAPPVAMVSASSVPGSRRCT